MFVVVFCLLAGVGGIQVTPAPGVVPRYRNYRQMTEFMSGLAANHSQFASLYTIGQSVEHRELWVLRIKAPAVPLLGAPHIKYIGNIHGNEPVGRELILYLAEYLLKNYETESEVKWILDRTIIHFLPSLNPDGFERSKEGDCYTGPGRENGNYVDLNRSFPDHFHENRVPVQPETAAVAHWTSLVPFALSVSFHGGALVANYPFDSSPGNGSRALVEELLRNASSGVNLWDLWNNLTPKEKDSLSPRSSLTPDDDVFRHLAATYADHHLTMHKGRTCNENQPSFPGGITNGAAWYSFAGGMQDYNYVSRGCMELTLEISCCKFPQAVHLPRLWAENKRAMLELLKQVHVGVRGLILDKVTSSYVADAVLHIVGRNVPFTSSKNGEFWRILLPGNYLLVVEAKGYESQSFPFTVQNANRSFPSPTWLNIYLQPDDDMLASPSSNFVRVVASSGHFPSFPLLLSLVCLFTNRNLS